MIRETCGTVRGLLAHQAAGEAACGWCAQAAHTARIAAERLAPLPAAEPAQPAAECYPAVTAEEAKRHAAVLGAEVAAFDRQHANGSRHRWLLLVKPEDAA